MENIRRKESRETEYADTDYKSNHAGDACSMLYVLTKTRNMQTKQQIELRLEWISKRIERLERRLYQINVAKDIALFKKHSNEKWNLLIERNRLLAELGKQW